MYTLTINKAIKKTLSIKTIISELDFLKKKVIVH